MFRELMKTIAAPALLIATLWLVGAASGQPFGPPPGPRPGPPAGPPAFRGPAPRVSPGGPMPMRPRVAFGSGRMPIAPAVRPAAVRASGSEPNRAESNSLPARRP